MEFCLGIIIFIVVILIVSIKQINEYERGIKFRFGKFVKILNPGWKIILPVIESYRKVDIRTKAVDVPSQEAITKDNVSVQINAVIYYKIFDASKAVLAVESYYYAVGQLAQTTMRNVVGAVSLDELLAERDKISESICKIIDEATDPWGIKVENVELKDVSLPEDMKRVLCVNITHPGTLRRSCRPQLRADSPECRRPHSLSSSFPPISHAISEL